MYLEYPPPIPILGPILGDKVWLKTLFIGHLILDYKLLVHTKRVVIASVDSTKQKGEERRNNDD